MLAYNMRERREETAADTAAEITSEEFDEMAKRTLDDYESVFKRLSEI